jgi:hypothetical protein
LDYFSNSFDNAKFNRLLIKWPSSPQQCPYVKCWLFAVGKVISLPSFSSRDKAWYKNPQPLYARVVRRYSMRHLGQILLFILTLTSCYRPCGFYKDIKRVTKEPTKDEMAGIYKPDERTIRVIRNWGFESDSLGQVIINKSGEFILIDVPRPFLVDRGKETISAKGVWKFYFNEHAQTNEIVIRYDSLGQLKGLIDGMRLYKRDDKLILFRFVGDPDDCQCLMYERQ